MKPNIDIKLARSFGCFLIDFGIFKRIYLVCWNDFQAGPANVRINRFSSQNVLRFWRCIKL